MEYYTGFSDAVNTDDAVSESTEKITSVVKLIIFAADYERFDAFTRILHRRFPSAQIIGSTTYIALSDKGSGKSALSLIALCGDVICGAGVILDIVRYPMKHKAAVDACLSSLGGRDNIVCFEMTTAFSNAEELVLDTLHASLGDDIPVLGSSAGACDGETHTAVSINGTVYAEGCVYALIAPPRKVHFYLENIYRQTGYKFMATDVDCERRIVYEFDRKPAAQVIAASLGVSADKLAELLPDHPLGRIISDEIYLVEGLGVRSDGEMEFFARIYNNTRMALMELDDTERVNKETLERINKDVPHPSFALVVNCLSRVKLFEEHGCARSFYGINGFHGDFFGISGYGEQLNCKHLNASMVIAVF